MFPSQTRDERLFLLTMGYRGMRKTGKQPVVGPFLAERRYGGKVKSCKVSQSNREE